MASERRGQEYLPAEPVKAAVTAEIEAGLEGTPEIFIFADISAPRSETVAESEPPKTDLTAKEETQKPMPIQAVQSAKPPLSSKPRMGDVRIVGGEKQIYIDGFGWIKDEGGGSIGRAVGNPGDGLTGNKAGIMGGSTTVDSKGDLNKQVGIMGGGTVAEDMYENGHKIGIMGEEECPSGKLISPPSEQPEPPEGWLAQANSMGKLASDAVKLGKSVKKMADVPPPLTPFTPTDSKQKRREALKKLAQGHKLQSEQEQEFGQKM